MRLLLIRFSVLLFIGLPQAGCKRNPNLQPLEDYMNVEGGKVWYRVLGEGRETPLLLMHGGPGGTSYSFYQFAEFTSDRPIILFDQLGSGRSGHHTDTSLLRVENFVEQVKALKEKLGLNEFYVLGHSWGSALALEYYLKYPEGIKGLLFNSPYFSTAVWDADADTLILTLPDSIQTAIRIGEETNDFTTEAYQQATAVFDKNFGLRKTKLTTELDTIPPPRNDFIYNYMWGPTEFTATGVLRNYDRLESLRAITVPVLFLTGEFDEARPATVQRFQRMVPGAQFALIEDAGHETMHDNREQNLAAIRNFLNNLEKR
jgi:proline iminopeptidase